ncbi:GGDEF domain-containing protein [Psychromonas hadalis]|uniref:GGDEF domain-containing protein n=1 Tax=Psychromonas hadalis TaxID=211669 RepID=UPI00041528B6|nr:GGDEF domain-containing protein [Psychromonas hadalis]
MMLSKTQNLLSWNERATGRALVQLVILQQSYLTNLELYRRGDNVYEQLLEHYDLTWSAYETLLAGSKNAYFVNNGQRIIKLKIFFKRFKKSDPMKVKLTGELITVTLHNTRQAHHYIIELLNYEFQGLSQQSHNRDFELVRLNKIIVISLLGLTFSGALFLFIILRDRRRMAHLAYHDPLTGIGNRIALQEKITELQKDKIGFCSLLIDIDRFKPINDTYGHDIGDKLLINLTQKMAVICGEQNFLGRLGGDEFVIIYLSQNSVEQTALKLLDITPNGLEINGCHCDINLSIGISCSRVVHKSWVDILKDADNAMYQAKLKGGGQYQIYVPD